MASLLNMSGGSLLNKGLPYDAEIEYLESTGTQFINTLYVPTSDEFRVEYGAYCGAGGGDIFVSVFNNSISNYFHANWFNGNSVYFRYMGTGHIYRVGYGDHVFEIGRRLKVDGELKYEYASNPSYYENNISPVILMAYNQNEQYPFKGKTYYVKAYLGNELVFDMIPVRKGQTGYMYDKISGQLFGNAGTGSFVLGRDIADMYEIEYLQGGEKTYINTGIIINSSNWRKIKIVFDGTFSSGSNSAWKCQGIGYYNPTFYIAISNGNRLSYGKGDGNDGQTSRTLTQEEYTSRHLYIADYVNAKVCFDNEEYAMSLASSTTLNYEFYVFTWNSGGYGSQNYMNGGKVYGFTIYEDGVKIRDFVPVRRRMTGYLLDKVSGQLFGNAGTGDFVLGPDK